MISDTLGILNLITRRSILPIFGAIPFARWPTENVPRVAETRIMFGGDVMLSRFVGRLARELHDPAAPMREIATQFFQCDLAFANLESPFSDRGRLVEQGMVFKAEPEMIAALAIAGLDVVSTANNHARDCGRYGIEFTLDWLERHGIAAVGTGRTEQAAHAGVVFERNGVKFGFLGYTFDQSNGNHSDVDERVAVLDVAQMRVDVAALLKRSDVAIVSMHAGTEYSTKPNWQQTAFARAAIDAGARVVAGHHPHVVQSWERYRDGVIFYSLGNLVFDQFQRAETQRGSLAQVTFAGKNVARVEMIPITLARAIPRVASGA